MSTVWLAPTVSVARTGDNLVLARRDRAVRIRINEAAGADLIEWFRSGVEVEDHPDGTALGRLLAQLRTLGWLISSIPAASAAPWGRQVGYWSMFTADPVAAQARVESAAVGVLGVGGVGCTIARLLAGSGVGRLHLIDRDVVEVTNLNRQLLFEWEDIGTPKVEAATRRLRRTFSHLVVSSSQDDITDAADLDHVPDGLDVLVVAADWPPDLMDLVWDWARRTEIPVVTVAIGLESGYWGPLLSPADAGCWPCFEAGRLAAMSELDRALHAAALPPARESFGPSNEIVSAFLARDLVLWLATGAGPVTERRVHLDLLTLDSTVCPVAACRGDH